ncbi:MAG: T9SS type A sorting domain-containing protein, partial [Chitinophagaceae bacterium]
LTVTDLCGNTATDQVSLVVNAAPPMPSISPSNPVLSHRNSFRDTLTYTQQAGLIYDWVENGSLLGNATNNLPLSFLNSSFSQYTVRITNPTTGCVSNTAPVSFSYAPGVLLNNNSALTVCDSSFYDVGGPIGPTGNNFTRTFTPSTPGTKLKLTIYNLDLANFATLFVYDGDNSGAPRIIALDQTSNGSSTKTFTASNPDGILTIRFSLGSFQSSGWLAGLTCEQPLQYRSIANGPWLNSINWESKLPAASLWTPASRHPNKGDDSIAIRHDITISEELQIDDVLVTSTGKLLLDNNGYINLYKVKPATELRVEAGAMVKVNTGSFIFGSGIIELKGTLQNEGAVTADNLIVNGTLPQQLINSTGNTSSISRLTMNNAAGLSTVGMHNVDALSLNNGLINTSANNTLRLDNTSAGNDNAYINGPVHFLGRSGMNKILPIGKNGAYRPVVLSAGSADGEGSATLKAEVIHGAAPTRTFPAGVSSVSSVRYYQLSAIENSVNLRDFAITLPYGIDDAVANPASLKIVKDDGATAWLDLGGAATGPAPGTITSEPFNSFSDFVLANVVAGPLPVSLLSFTGRWNNDKPVLNWRVENEINLSRYEIERGSTPNSFTRIGVVNAFNLASAAYQFNDEQSIGTMVFYRLKMIDINGEYRYSNIIQLERAAISKDKIISISPNPFQSHITVQYQSRANQSLGLQLFDSKGRLVKQFSLNVVEGVNQLHIEASALAAGTYILHLKTARGTIHQKIVKE